MFKLDGGLQRNIETRNRNIKPTYNYSPVPNKVETFQSNLNQKLLFDPKKFTLRTENPELDEFADFSLKTSPKIESKPKEPQKGLGIFELKRSDSKQRGLLSEENSTKSPTQFGDSINLSEVRSLNSKLRFLTKDDINRLDKSTIEELRALALNIKRFFDQ